MTNSIVANNSVPASSDGSITQHGGGVYIDTGTANLTNSTVASNTNEGLRNKSGTANILNSIFWDNTSSQISGNATVTYSDVQGGFTGVGNIDLNPVLIDDVNCPYLRIASVSPCVDAGNPDAQYNDDCFGNISHGSKRNDMGAHGGPGAREWPCADCPPIYHGKVEIDQMWSADFGGQFMGEFIPGDGLIIHDMYTVIDDDDIQYGLLQIYKLVDSKKKRYSLGQQWRRRGPGTYYFAFNKATIPNDAAVGKAKIKVNVQLKKKGEIIDQKFKGINIYIK
jgi:hypothetical protein